MKIGILTSWDFNDPNAWSGVIFNAREALADRAEIVLIQVPEARDSLVDRALAKFLGNLGFVYLTSDAFASAFRKIRVVRKLISNQQLDLVISLAASKESLGVPHNIPLIQVTDSSFRAMVGSYFKDKKVSFLCRFQGQILDFLVARKTDHYCVASDWSARQLMSDVRVKSHDISVIPFGPGIVPSEKKVVSPEVSDLAILFVASDWKRKGGEKVLQAFARARAQRPGLKLTVVGAPSEIPVDGVIYLPKQAKAELSALYNSHDILLEPTEASAGGVVVTDALNHGLPVISTKIGGIPTLVKDGKTGWLVSPDQQVQQITEILLGLTPEQIRRASLAARRDADLRLNWRTWSESVVEISKKIMK